MKKSINQIINYLGYTILKVGRVKKSQNQLLLNIGSGNWSCKGWLNLDYPSEWYHDAQKAHTIIPYDIRSNPIPFSDNEVDAIYCSHVIEHIEDQHIEHFFEECNRVLKQGGALRIACPDAEFLYQMSLFPSDYWLWRTDWFTNEFFYAKEKSPRLVDYLVREIATPKLLNYKNAITQTDYFEAFETMQMEDFFEFMKEGLVFRNNFVGDHINYWTFAKIKSKLEQSGFKHIIRSKWNGSCKKEMLYKHKFDTTYPLMSLYVEAIK